MPKSAVEYAEKQAQRARETLQAYTYEPLPVNYTLGYLLYTATNPTYSKEIRIYLLSPTALLVQGFDYAYVFTGYAPHPAKYTHAIYDLMMGLPGDGTHIGYAVGKIVGPRKEIYDGDLFWHEFSALLAEAKEDRESHDENLRGLPGYKPASDVDPEQAEALGHIAYAASSGDAEQAVSLAHQYAFRFADLDSEYISGCGSVEGTVRHYEAVHAVRRLVELLGPQARIEPVDS